MKGSPFKQATLEGENKMSGGNTKKAKNKPKKKTVTDFSGKKEPVNNPMIQRIKTERGRISIR